MSEHQVVEGVTLRQFGVDDAGPMFEVVDGQRPYLREWLPWVDRTHSAEDVRNFVRAVVGPQEAAGRGPNYVIRVDGAVAGSVGCHPIDWLNRSASLGYWLDARHQGRGIMTRSVVVLIDYLFNELDLHRVVIQCGTGNHRSSGIPERLGFQLEGVLREAQWVNDRWLNLKVWGMLAEEWRNRDGL